MGLTFQPSTKFPGFRLSWQMTSPYASVYEHVAYGHQAAGPVDVLPYEVVSRIPCMIGQQQPSASACRVTHPLSGLFSSVWVHSTMRSQIFTGVKNCPCDCWALWETSAMYKSPKGSYQLVSSFIRLAMSRTHSVTISMNFMFCCRLYFPALQWGSTGRKSVDDIGQ